LAPLPSALFSTQPTKGSQQSMDLVGFVEKFKAQSYDLVILDINMPELNGFALYLEIKRLDTKVKICFHQYEIISLD